MKNFIAASVLLLCSAAPAPAVQGVTPFEIDRMATQLLVASRQNLSGRVEANEAAAGGFASIRAMNGYAVIYVSPRRLRAIDRNSWAFVTGHELSHALLRHGPGSQGPGAEWAADEAGARMAVTAGYNIRSYIRFLYTMPNSCSPSHGCWHGRARNLELKFRTNTGLWRDEHAGHRAGIGFPWSSQSGCVGRASACRCPGGAHLIH